LPLHSFEPAQDAFVSVLQPLLPLHSFLPLQQFFPSGGVAFVDGVFGSAFCSPPQAARPAIIPVTAVIAKTLPRFITHSPRPKNAPRTPCLSEQTHSLFARFFELV